MRPVSSVLLGSILLVSSLASSPGSVAAQLIELRTVPVAAGDQFATFPSLNLGMGGASIALDDPLLDPFVNPAKGGRLTAPVFFSSPTFYSVSHGNGVARTLPAGALFASPRWFGGATGAIQQMEMGGRIANAWVPIDPASTVDLPSPLALPEKSSTNKYFQAMVGRKFGGGRFAVAAGAMLADLNMLDGIDQLFVNAWDIDEFGHIEDYRLGFTGTFPGERTLEAVLVHNRFSMTHDVTTVNFIVTDSVRWRFTPDVTQEANLDQTNTWGVHLGYVQPIGESTWRVGGMLTANRKLHPKIPTYDLEAVRLPEPDARLVPRDPGDSWAYRIGLGISKQAVNTTFGLDVVYEPAESYTWANEPEDVTAADGSVIPAGAKTVENRFVFSNASLNAGIRQAINNVAIQLGLRVHAVDYRLRQEDHVQVTSRRQSEEWVEWTPSWGVSVGFAGLELRYQGWASSASHFPFFYSRSRVFDPSRFQDNWGSNLVSAAGVLAAPRGDLTIPDFTVISNRLAISVPIR
jgi:hypothetical protein